MDGDRRHEIDQAVLEPQLVRAARMLLDWTQRDLAAAADVPAQAISRFENKGEASAAAVGAILGALRNVGVHLHGDKTGRGIWLRRAADKAGVG